MKEAKDIELRSDEVQEILTRPPHALIRYGISVICGVLVVLFIGSFFFCYPDVNSGSIVITTENPPVWIIARSTGKIQELRCYDKQRVNQGDILAIIDNTASVNDVLSMKQLLDSVRVSDSIYYLPKKMLTTAYELGEIQSSFSAFAKAATNYNNYLSLNLILQEKESLHRQMSDRSVYTKNLRKQFDLKQKELMIVRSDYERTRKLYEDKVVSESELEATDQKLLNKQQELQQLQTSISLEKVQSTQIQGTTGKLSVQYQQEKNELFSELKSAYRELITATENWQQNYLLVSPQKGIVTFSSFWQKNQFVSSGNKVFAIILQHPGRLVGKVAIPLAGSAKIKRGQMANVKLSGYPYLEYGILQGYVSNMSLIPNGNNYTVEVVFPHGLYSTTRKYLKITGEMNGTAEIITENRSLIQRLITPLKYLLSKESIQ